MFEPQVPPCRKFSIILFELSQNLRSYPLKRARKTQNRSFMYDVQHSCVEQMDMTLYDPNDTKEVKSRIWNTLGIHKCPLTYYVTGQRIRGI